MSGEHGSYRLRNLGYLDGHDYSDPVVSLGERNVLMPDLVMVTTVTTDGLWSAWVRERDAYWLPGASERCSH